MAECRRNNAVEHIHAALDRFEEVNRRSHSHEIPRSVMREQDSRVLNDVFPFIFRLADSESAQSISIEGDIGNLFGALAPKLWEAGTLNDTEERLRGISSGIEAALRPTSRKLHRIASRCLIGGGIDAVIQHHHDVASDGSLCRDTYLRGQENLPAISITPEARTLFGHLEETGQGEDLETSGIGEDRSRPAHELLNPSDLLEERRSRVQQEVIGVGEENLISHRFSNRSVHPTQRAVRGHRHEDWRFHHAVSGLKPCRPRIRRGIGSDDGEIL